MKNIQELVHFTPTGTRGTHPAARGAGAIYSFSTLPIVDSVAIANAALPSEGGSVDIGQFLAGYLPYGMVASTIDLKQMLAGAVPVPTLQVETHEVEGEQIRERLHEVFRLLAREPIRVSSTDARQDFAELIRRADETNRPVLIANHGKPEALLLSFGVFQKIVKGLARQVLALRRRRSVLSDRAAELIDAEMDAINARLRRAHGQVKPHGQVT